MIICAKLFLKLFSRLIERTRKCFERTDERTAISNFHELILYLLFPLFFLCGQTIVSLRTSFTEWSDLFSIVCVYRYLSPIPKKFSETNGRTDGGLSYRYLAAMRQGINNLIHISYQNYESLHKRLRDLLISGLLLKLKTWKVKITSYLTVACIEQCV